MSTRLVNLHRCSGKAIVKIDRTTMWGNPFRIPEDGNRSQVIRKYKHYFIGRVRSDGLFKSRVARLKGRVLGCWCTPKSCHGNVIIEYLKELDE